MELQSTGADARDKYEALIVPEERAYEYRDDFARLIEAKKISIPVLYSIDQAIDMVAAGRMQLWLFRVIDDPYPCLAMLTEILNYPAGRTVNICLMVGSKLVPMTKRFLPMFLYWCKRHHADYVEATTHPSISKMLIKYGFMPTGVRVHYPLATLQ